MTTEEKTLLSVLAIAAVLVPITLGAALDWPAWSWLLLTVPLLGAVGLVVRNIYRRVQYELPSQPYVEPSLPVEQQDPGRQTPVGDLTLPSASTGYDFHFSATVYWRPTRGLKTAHANLGKLAVDAILVRARTITAAEQQKDVDVVQHRLASELSTVLYDGTRPELWKHGPTMFSSRCPKPTSNGYASFWSCARTSIFGNTNAITSAAS